MTLFHGRHYEQIATRELLPALRRTLDQVKPDAVVVQGWGLSYSLAAHHWAATNSVPVVLTCESARADHHRGPFREWIKSRVVRLCASALVGGRPHAEYVTELGIRKERVFAGYDVVENEHFLEGAESARRRSRELRAAHGLPENYFLASARFVEKKNLRRLLQAFAGFRELSASRTGRPGGIEAKAGAAQPEARSWCLVLLGDGPLRESLTALSSSLGLQKQLLIPGFKRYEELPMLYGLAGTFIHASTTEQWGLVVNEAMASSLPVLVSDRCGCAQDLVRTGANGFTFDSYNVEQLAELMLRMAEMEAPLRVKLGQESQRIVRRWGPGRFASGLKAAVGCALSAPPKRACRFDRLLLRLLMKL